MKTCSVDGCGKPNRARGLCATHYNQAYQPNRHRKVEESCTYCGATVLKDVGASRRRKVFCDYTCRDLWRLEHGNRGDRVHDVTERALVPYVAVPSPRVVAEPPPPIRVRFVSAQCFECGQMFIGDRSALWSMQALSYCSSKCAARSGRRRRRALEHGQVNRWRWSDFMRIWLRFDGRCAYCQHVVAGQPDPDHVIPLSRGGADMIGNLLPSCRSCNCDKRDLLLPEWREDRLRRGLPPVTTTWSVDDARIWHLTLARSFAA